MRSTLLLIALAGCHHVFGLDDLGNPMHAPDASVMRDGVADGVVGDVREADAFTYDAETGCAVVEQVGCTSPTAACYPQSGDDFCAEPGAGVDGVACSVDPDCARGYFCGGTGGSSSGVCFRICDCAMAPGSTCNQPTACSSTATQQCRQYTTTFGYCEL